MNVDDDVDSDVECCVVGEANSSLNVRVCGSVEPFSAFEQSNRRPSREIRQGREDKSDLAEKWCERTRLCGN